MLIKSLKFNNFVQKNKPSLEHKVGLSTLTPDGFDEKNVKVQWTNLMIYVFLGKVSHLLFTCHNTITITRIFSSMYLFFGDDFKIIRNNKNVVNRVPSFTLVNIVLSSSKFLPQLWKINSSLLNILNLEN